VVLEDDISDVDLQISDNEGAHILCTDILNDRKSLTVPYTGLNNEYESAHVMSIKMMAIKNMPI
jgi:hypothetical protein